MQLFVVPDLHGPVTGGTLFNRMLVSSLSTAGVACAVLSAAAAIGQATAADVCWVDSLFLDQIPRLRRLSKTGRVGLLAHYLPSLVEHGEQLDRRHLTSAEAEALRWSESIVVPSDFMRGIVAGLLGTPRPVLVLEPGRLATGPATLPAPPMRAVLVANLSPGKGVLPFLQSLAAQVHQEDYVLDIIGADDFDVAYAQACKRAASERRLGGRVGMKGALPPEETVATMARANLLVSASTMESYGMAVAEARTLGLPVMACPGGNVQHLVAEDGGDEIVRDPAALANALIALCRDPDEHRARLDRAARRALPPRPWATVAAELVQGTGGPS
jgi:glycosyltransferase involved in cell wall biosynthesis